MPKRKPLTLRLRLRDRQRVNFTIPVDLVQAWWPDRPVIAVVLAGRRHRLDDRVTAQYVSAVRNGRYEIVEV